MILQLLLLSVVTDNLEHTKFKRGSSSEARNTMSLTGIRKIQPQVIEWKQMIKGEKLKQEVELVLEVKSLIQIIDDLEEKSRENISTIQNL